MLKNPIINGVLAFAYIVTLVLVLHLGTQAVPHPNQLIAPIAVISLFTLSAAIMAYLFCYQPLLMLFDSKRKQAIQLFLQTTAVFSVFTAGVVALMFSGMFS